MKNLALAVLVFLLFSGCTKKKRYDELTYSNDFEQISGWYDDSHLSNGPAHSGFYSWQIDSVAAYGLNFKRSFTDISSKKLTKIKYSAWVFVKDLNVDGRLVIDIQDNTGKSYNWFGLNTRDFIRNVKEWSLISGEINIPSTIPQTRDYKVVVYGWNVAKASFWIDDMEIKFE